MRISDWSSDVCSSDLAALHRESGFQRIVGDMAEGGQPGARADRAEDEALAPVAGKELRRLARDLGGAAVDLLGAVGKAERSAERRVGQEWVSTCRSRWSPYNQKNKNNTNHH